MSRASSQEQRGKAWIINGDNWCNGIGINNKNNIIDNNNNIIDNTSNDNI
jgi:pyruvate/2-oxoacid:ferredoxin oxidoreductase beta subunit